MSHHKLTNYEISRIVQIIEDTVFDPGSAPQRIDDKLEAAAASNSIATFEYKKPESDEYETRVVRVEDFAESRGPDYRFYYITAFDYDRQNYRHFRLSRMRAETVKVAQ